jgi:hypothetical protein
MKIVNVKDYGGVANAIKAGVIYCGRPSILGNPCSVPNTECPVCRKIHFGKEMKQLTNCRSIPCYRKWLWDQIKCGNKALIKAIVAIPANALLGCWCFNSNSPVLDSEYCHTQVIAKARLWLINNTLKRGKL